MNYDSPAEIRATLGDLGLSPHKRWGQNFLVNPHARQRIVDLLDPEPADTVWEVGPGLGCLTVLLLPKVRSLVAQPPPRRDLIQRHLYLAANSLVVSRGCPHACDFCYKESFFRGGASFYAQTVDQTLADIERLPGRHLFFVDDNIFGHREFAIALFDAMRGMGRIWQAAGTVDAALDSELLHKAAASGKTVPERISFSVSR